MKKTIFLLSIILTLGSCKPTQLIVHDIQYKNKVQHDSIYLEKNNTVTTYTKGDTVFVYRINTEWKYKYVFKTDSVNKYVDKPVMIPMQVEKKLTRIQELEIWLGKIFAGIIGLFLIYVLYKTFPFWSKIFIKKI